MKTKKESDVKQIMKSARNEKSFQLGLERMQLAIAKGEVSLEKSIKAADDELTRIKQRDNELTKLGIKPVSNYTTLHQLYEGQLKKVTLEQLIADAEIKASKYVAKAQAKVTEEQEKVVIDFYHMNATRSYQIVGTVKNVLKLKGLIKEEATKQGTGKKLPAKKEEATVAE